MNILKKTIKLLSYEEKSKGIRVLFLVFVTAILETLYIYSKYGIDWVLEKDNK